jgi:hypothetical protein
VLACEISFKALQFGLQLGFETLELARTVVHGIPPFHSDRSDAVELIAVSRRR